MQIIILEFLLKVLLFVLNEVNGRDEIFKNYWAFNEIYFDAFTSNMQKYIMFFLYQQREIGSSFFF